MIRAGTSSSGTNYQSRQAKEKFSHSGETICRRFTDVLESVYKLAADVIKPKDPTFSMVHRKLQEPRFWPHFRNCLGAIDGTHIPVTVPSTKQPVHIGSHGYPSQNVMAVCNFDMRFTFVVWLDGRDPLMILAFSWIL